MVVSSAVLCHDMSESADTVSMGTAVYTARCVNVPSEFTQEDRGRSPSSTFHYESVCKWENTLELSIILKTAISGIPSQANDDLQNCHALQSFQNFVKTAGSLLINF